MSHFRSKFKKKPRRIRTQALSLLAKNRKLKIRTGVDHRVKNSVCLYTSLFFTLWCRQVLLCCVSIYSENIEVQKLF